MNRTGDEPARVSIRAAGPWDAEALAELHATTWRQAYADLLPADVVDSEVVKMPVQWQRRLTDPGSASFWVAEEPGGLVGFSWAEAVGPGSARSLSLVGLYVLDSHHGTGVADQLLVCAVGEAPCELWVAEGNERAAAFYQRHGFEFDGVARQVPEWGDITIQRMIR
ncbi:MAG TPA: GNAT family N-acetyltransferase [Beutenbergiaceae bacterium]|nr:GNAT family N-acetyltransferase [Beutenbergiaceae bacterium]